MPAVPFGAWLCLNREGRLAPAGLVWAAQAALILRASQSIAPSLPVPTWCHQLEAHVLACPRLAVARRVASRRVRAAEMGGFRVGKKWWIGSTRGIVARYARSASGCTTVGIIV